MIKVGIVGAAGYTGGELLRILLTHPDVAIKFAHSNSSAGQPVWKVHSDLIGYTDLVFGNTLSNDIDVLFLCMGHGDSKVFLEKYQPESHVRIIDLSQDFRIVREGNTFVYGLPELNKETIKKAFHVANPGCFATCIQLGLLPLAKHEMLKQEVHITAITGSTGAGQKPTETSHFSWRANNLSVYKAFEHQHLKEINQSLHQLQPHAGALNFVPMRGDFTRGIFASMYLNVASDLDNVIKLYKQYYNDAPFTHVVDENPDLKMVVNTNNCLVYLQKYGDKLHIISMIDNLTKGASGQAVQNMNIMFGLDETKGLRLKGVGF